MDPNFVATISYPCPRCGIGLQARSVRIPEWLRCPNCGKGGVPPMAAPKRTPLNVAKFAYDPDVLVIGEEVMLEPETPWYGTTRLSPVRPVGPPPAGPPPSESGRTGLTVLFSLCLSLFFVLLFLGEGFKAGLFGVAAGILLLFMVRPSRRPARP